MSAVEASTQALVVAEGTAAVPADPTSDALAPTGKTAVGGHDPEAARPRGTPREVLDTVFARMDRKATAIAEFTLRQYRTRASTWTVLGVGALVVALVLLIYFQSMGEEMDAVDQDSDSQDWDGDGWPTGQERRLGTDPHSASSHPDPDLDPPESPDMWVNEDPFQWDGQTITLGSIDEDGDCNPEVVPPGTRNLDTNGDGVPCRMTLDEFNGQTTLSRDAWVNEDPDDERLRQELLHRGVIIGTGKMLFLLLLGIFLPLFLATPLVRDEIERSTIHYLAGKPLARGELLAYRLLGFIALTWSYMTIIVVLAALVTGFVGSGDSFYRFGDLGVWFAILVASWLLLLFYGVLFATFGIAHRMGMVAAIVAGLWELMMGLVGLALPTSNFVRLSGVYWAFQIVDAAAGLVWTDQRLLSAVGLAFHESIPGGGGMLWNEPAFLSGGWSTMLGSIGVLLGFTALVFWVGQGLFRGKELS